MFEYVYFVCFIVVSSKYECYKLETCFFKIVTFKKIFSGEWDEYDMNSKPIINVMT